MSEQGWATVADTIWYRRMRDSLRRWGNLLDRPLEHARFRRKRLIDRDRVSLWQGLAKTFLAPEERRRPRRYWASSHGALIVLRDQRASAR